MKEFINKKGEVLKLNDHFILDLKTTTKLSDIQETNGYKGIYMNKLEGGNIWNEQRAFHLFEKLPKSALTKPPSTTLINEKLETITLAPEVIWHIDDKAEVTGHEKNFLGRFMMIEKYNENGNKWNNQNAFNFWIFTKPEIKQEEEKENEWTINAEIPDEEANDIHNEITKSLNSLAENTNVNNPSHYGGKGNTYEVINILEYYKMGFDLGNAIKYIIRAGKKDPDKKIEDLKKAQWYLNRNIINEIEARNNPNEEKN